MPILSAQETETMADSLIQKPKRKKPITLRGGIDLYGSVRSQVDDQFSGFEWVTDVNLTDDLYVAAEVGTVERTIQSEQINFTADGSFIKLGIDYNMYENWKGMDNQVYIGLRFARSTHALKVNNYVLYTTDHFFDQNPIASGYSSGSRTGLTAQWLEVIAGVKTAIVKNIYLGFSLRLNVLMSDTQPTDFDNLYIPGFQKVTDENRFGIGFNYTLTYALPFRLGKKSISP